MDNNNFLAGILRSLSFVQWDRYTIEDGAVFRFYGWIDREKDAYKDFVLLTYDYGDDTLSCTTSSAKYSEEIARILFGDDGNHSDCLRIEKDFDIPNVIRLDGKEPA